MWKKIAIGVLCCVLLLSFAGCGAANGAFKKAVEILEAGDSSYYKVAEDKSYIKVDTNPFDIEDFYDRSIMESVKEVNAALGFSDALYEKMMQTRSLDGRVSDESKNFKASWSYHPDSGMTVLYEKK